jgi:two-component system, LytTR family, response regulator
MLNAVIIDDEVKGREVLNELVLEHCPQVSIVGMADSAVTGVELIKNLKPNLVFLDIEMPFGNGFDLLEKVEENNFDVIFTTAYDHYAVKAIKFSALDYLLKPISAEDLKEAVAKAYEQFVEQRNISMQLEHLLKNVRSSNLPTKIALATLNGLQFINIDQIITCKADGSYTELQLASNEKLVITKALKEFEDLFNDYNFFRIHHSYIINLNRIKKYIKGNGGYVIMENDVSIDVSTRKKKEFLTKINVL